ncbi:hypothetical protein Kpol_507p16, partial [Vanderwaltozyma polyspora DSM 70294]
FFEKHTSPLKGMEVLDDDDKRELDPVRKRLFVDDSFTDGDDLVEQGDDSSLVILEEEPFLTSSPIKFQQNIILEAPHNDNSIKVALDESPTKKRKTKTDINLTPSNDCPGQDAKDNQVEEDLLKEDELFIDKILYETEELKKILNVDSDSNDEDL